MKILDLLSIRRSGLAFDSTPIAAEQLRLLFEAARWSASCFNEQPWRFMLATIDEPAEHARLASCLVPANREWATKAPVLILACACKNFARNLKPNRQAEYDVGQAVQNLVVQATHIGLMVHQMGGFDAAVARELYALPADVEALAVIALGRPGNPATLSAALREREAAPRSRKSQSEFIFTGRFGKIAALIERAD